MDLFALSDPNFDFGELSICTERSGTICIGKLTVESRCLQPGYMLFQLAAEPDGGRDAGLKFRAFPNVMTLANNA